MFWSRDTKLFQWKIRLAPSQCAIIPNIYINLPDMRTLCKHYNKYEVKMCARKPHRVLSLGEAARRSRYSFSGLLNSNGKKQPHANCTFKLGQCAFWNIFENKYL